MPSIDRREFLKVVGLTATSTLIPTMADGIETPGTSPAPDWETLVPADKHLDPAWIASITERGSPTVYSRPDLKFVGMPVGGLFAGQLYLGGDGKLWLWDIFNGLHNTAGEHYAHPQEAFSPVDQGFILRVGDKDFPLDATGFSDITFRGEYPIGIVTYKDPACPVTVTMEAFSPFCPLDADFSSLPATVMRITIRNHSPGSVDLELLARLQNAVCQNSLPLLGGILKSKNVLHRGLIEFSAEADQSKSDRPVNAPTIFTDFEGETFDPWVADGHAFGKGPTAGAPDPAQHLSGFSGRKLANSWATRSDTPTGKLTSPAFVISRPYINFLIGGGNHPGQTCINLLVDGKRVLTTTGKNSDVMEWASFPVSRWMNKKATLEIIDDHSGDWGHIEIDQIEFADEPRGVRGDLRDQPDFGTMCLALLDHDGDWGFRDQPDADPSCGAIYTQVSLEPQAEKTISFAITWHFPNLNFAVTRWDPLHKIVPSDVIEKGRHYATRFDSAQAVAEFVSDHHEDFYRQTKLWRDTWYDSTLPYWFLDRTIANISTLATTTSYRFADGRYWGYEGVGSCRGTCTHVYGYEQSVGRLFPELDILLRERTDFGVGFNDKTGAIGMRGERSAPAVDGTCMILLRTLRDHQMSADDSFLKTYWPKIKQAMTWLIAQDHNRDGILLGAQANTLDAEWYGAVPWISGLYLAAMAAGAELAGVAGDTEFAGECQTLLEAGQKNFAAKMFNGEYFVQIADKKHLKAVGSFDGCEIDQVLGQSWAFQVGLGRVLPEKQTRAALAALWKYNFAKDVGPFRAAYKPGRWFAMPGETGTIMCSWPRGEQHRVSTGFDYYFNECMNGFEHQLAGHMIWEGMVTEGLAIERAVHDRYHASRRNPWNEIECGDHYARSMASFGVFLAACGFEYNGPAGVLGFAPKMSPENFRAPFVTAQGWGTFSQSHDGRKMTTEIAIKYGKLKLSSLVLAQPEKIQPNIVSAMLAEKPVEANLKVIDGKIRIGIDATVEKDQTLHFILT